MHAPLTSERGAGTPCLHMFTTEQGYQAQAPVVKRFKHEVMVRLDHNPLTLNVEPLQFDQDKLS
eukprot:scaffold13365_cov91-Skeletonema_menzelii.AAC.1